VIAIPDQPTLITGDVMRFREAAGSAKNPGLIEVHIIKPGRGSSGYYTQEVLKKACESGVYPAGMHMHMDHPTAKQEEDQPARTVGTIAAVLAENAVYRDEGDPAAWDGPGPYAHADVRPDRREDLAWLSGKIGVSHYVSGTHEETSCPDGKRGRLIKELIPSPFNSVDFVTIPGAGGHSRSIAEVLKESQSNNQRKNMADNHQESLTLAEVRSKYPEVIAEIQKQEREALKIDALNEAQKKELKESADTIAALKAQLKEAKAKLAEGKAHDLIAAQVKDAKLTETAAKTLTESLMAAVPLAEDGAIDAVKFGVTITEAIKGKQAEIAAILKESGYTGIRDNGGTPGAGAPADAKKAKEEYIRVLVEGGMPKEQAEKLAEA